MIAESVAYYGENMIQLANLLVVPTDDIMNKTQKNRVLQCLQYEQWAGPQKDPK